jgi:hypothetical protein
MPITAEKTDINRLRLSEEEIERMRDLLASGPELYRPDVDERLIELGLIDRSETGHMSSPDAADGGYECDASTFATNFFFDETGGVRSWFLPLYYNRQVKVDTNFELVYDGNRWFVLSNIKDGKRRTCWNAACDGFESLVLALVSEPGFDPLSRAFHSALVTALDAITNNWGD